MTIVCFALLTNLLISLEQSGGARVAGVGVASALYLH